MTAFQQKTRPRRDWSLELSPWVGLWLVLPLLVMLGALVVLPLIALVQMAVQPPAGFGSLASYFRNSSNLTVLRTTFVDAAVVTAFSVGLGGVLAWTLRTTQSRLVRVGVLAAVFVPFWMGGVVKLYALSVLFGRAGVVNSLLQAAGVIDQPLSILYTPFAVIIGMAYQMLPYAVLPMYVAFHSIDLDLVAAAQGLGATRARAIVSVVLPLALSGTLATLTIVYVICLGFFLTPVILGGLTSPFVATIISSDLFDFGDLQSAAISGLVLLVGAAIVIGIGYAVVGRERLTRAIG